MRKGNPIASCRFRWQTFDKVHDYPFESEWDSTRADAIRNAAKYLIKEFNRFGKDDIVVKIFNEMNTGQKPTIITLEQSYKIIENENSQK